jgi:hypothetical protein
VAQQLQLYNLHTFVTTRVDSMLLRNAVRFVSCRPKQVLSTTTNVYWHGHKNTFLTTPPGKTFSSSYSSSSSSSSNSRSSTRGYHTSTTSKIGAIVQNPNLSDLEGNDYLYHIGLNPAEDDLKRFFHDVKFVCMGGSVGRMEEFAQSVADELGEHESVAIPFGMRPSAIGKTDRYSMFKVGPVLISSHGMGQPSMSILLHEVAKLLDYAGADDPVFIRLGEYMRSATCSSTCFFIEFLP